MNLKKTRSKSTQQDILEEKSFNIKQKVQNPDNIYSLSVELSNTSHSLHQQINLQTILSFRVILETAE